MTRMWLQRQGAWAPFVFQRVILNLTVYLCEFPWKENGDSNVDYVITLLKELESIMQSL